MSELIKLLPKIRGIYRENAKLKNWFDLKGRAEILFRPADIDDLQHFLKNVPSQIPVTILGAASNVIIKDEGIKGVVIRLSGEFAKISYENNSIKVGAAALCGNVALYTKNEGLTNLEFLTGIPGAIGGAIAMNAGCYGSEIADFLISATALNLKGNLIELKNSDFNFSYRSNKIAKNFIFVEAIFKVEESNIKEVGDKIAQFNLNRQNSQPIRAKTGGSTFKNPPIDDKNQKKAWQLIDEAGSRGARKNDAQISEKHCNFMINTNSASAQDLIDLGNEARQKVKDQFGVNLEWEIKILG